MKFNKLLNTFFGEVLSIGINSEKILKKIENNDLVNNFLTLNNSLDGNQTKKKLKYLIYIEDLRKKFKYKTIDIVLVDYNAIKPFFISFISDSIYICKEKIYIINLDKDSAEKLSNKFKRYKTINKIYDNNVLEINCKNKYPNYFKDKFYKTVDEINNFFN